FRDFFASIRDIVGGRSGSYEAVLRDARETATRDMVAAAQAMGANGIVGVDIDYASLGRGGSMLMVTITGTAVTLSQG
ncbi:MAG: YbjQ family protein, partial [Beijerinckiaceae bacterium]